MGGILILIAVGASTILWMDLSNRFVWVVLFVTLSFGAIGWVDDYRKVVHHDPEGMKSREKFFWQSLVGVIASVYLAFSVAAPGNEHIWVGASVDGERFYLYSSSGKKQSADSVL